MLPAFEINLLQDKLDLSKLREEFKNMLADTSISFMWSPFANDVCPSSIAKYFFDNGYTVNLCKNTFVERSEYGLKFPSITDEFCFAELSEYVGMVLLGCNVEESDFSSYRIPDDNVDVGRGKVIHCKGFINQNTNQQLIFEALKILNQNPSFPWIALSFVFSEASSKLFLITKDKIHLI